jgi:hypothetical protein
MSSRQTLGLNRRKREQHPCGLCGDRVKLTRTHIPPQCAGNRGLVGRRRLVVDGGQADLTKRSPGGLYVYGLCPSCNNLQSRFDAAYGELAGAVRPLWIRDARIRTAGKLPLPGDEIRPGAVARSMLIGFLGLSPQLRVNFPDLPLQLLAGAPAVILPMKLRLRLALARGTMARLTGSIVGFISVDHPPDEDAVGIANVGQVYFPPLAWQLAPPEPSALLRKPSKSLLDQQGWADVTSWALHDPDERIALSTLCPALPAVVHPKHHPAQAEWWVEVLSSQITEIIECDNVPPT